jgi:osmotically-inducible protein OsmY
MWLHMEHDRILLECLGCGQQTPGWHIDVRRTSPVVPRSTSRAVSLSAHRVMRSTNQSMRLTDEENDMTTMSLTDTDLRVRDSVLRQLDWDPEVDNSAVGAAAKNGVVTLTGYIDSYSGKLAAERAAKRVHGVRAVANDIEVRLRLGRTDSDIAADAARALELRSTVPESVQAVVHDGHITLTGRVTWIAQKRNAEKAVCHIRGVKGVLNHIDVSPSATERDVRHRIVEALHRNADLDARHVTVTVSGAVATLTGSVSSWLQRDAAEHAAANAPGVTNVDNRITVEPRQRSEESDEIC